MNDELEITGEEAVMIVFKSGRVIAWWNCLKKTEKRVIRNQNFEDMNHNITMFDKDTGSAYCRKLGYWL